MTEPDINSYHTSLLLRLDWSEMDLFGHINNTVYFKFMQASRMQLFEAMDFAQHVTPTGLGPILASVQCQFTKPLFYPGNIEIKGKVSFIKNTSFGIEHVILNDQKEVCAIGSDVIVTYDFDQQQKLAIPEWLRGKLENYQ